MNDKKPEILAGVDSTGDEGQEGLVNEGVVGNLGVAGSQVLAENVLLEENQGDPGSQGFEETMGGILIQKPEGSKKQETAATAQISAPKVHKFRYGSSEGASTSRDTGSTKNSPPFDWAKYMHSDDSDSEPHDIRPRVRRIGVEFRDWPTKKDNRKRTSSDDFEFTPPKSDEEYSSGSTDSTGCRGLYRTSRRGLYAATNNLSCQGLCLGKKAEMKRSRSCDSKGRKVQKKPKVTIFERSSDIFRQVSEKLSWGQNVPWAPEEKKFTSAGGLVDRTIFGNVPSNVFEETQALKFSIRSLKLSSDIDKDPINALPSTPSNIFANIPCLQPTLDAEGQPMTAPIFTTNIFGKVPFFGISSEEELVVTPDTAGNTSPDDPPSPTASEIIENEAPFLPIKFFTNPSDLYEKLNPDQFDVPKTAMAKSDKPVCRTDEKGLNIKLSKKGSGTWRVDKSGAEGAGQTVSKYRLQVPGNLEKILSDDKLLIQLQDKLPSVPAGISVCELVNDYFVSYQQYQPGHLQQHYGEIAEGLINYFDLMLPEALLYEEEIPQYLDLKETFGDSMRPSEYYGIMHLLRLMWNFGDVLPIQELPHSCLDYLKTHMECFLFYLLDELKAILSGEIYEED